MLQELIQYAERKGLAGAGYSTKTVKWAIRVDSEGKCPGISELGNPDEKRNRGRDFDYCPETPGMNSGGKSHFLVETVETVLLFGKKADDEAVIAKHEFFVRLLRDAVDLVPEFAAFADILEDDTQRGELREEAESRKAKASDKITLMVRGRDEPFLVNDPAWRPWWNEFRLSLVEPKAKGKNGKGGKMLCFASGEMVEPAETHPKITQLASVGASSMGALMVSFDKDAFCSYGLKKSTNAAMSEDGAAAYRAAMENILANHSERLAGTKLGYWYDKTVPSENDPLALLFDPSEPAEPTDTEKRQAMGRFRDLLRSIETGGTPDFEKYSDTHYSVMMLSGNGGRVVVQDWMTGPYRQLLEGVIQWFDDLAIIGYNGSAPTKNPKLETVVTSLLPERKRDQKYEDWIKPAGMLRAAVWQSVLNPSAPLPHAAMAKSVLRFSRFIEDGGFEDIQDDSRNVGLKVARIYCTLGLLKTFHLRSSNGGIPMDAKLMHDHPKREYHCGRLMAVLAEIQRVALSKVGEDGRWTGVNAGVVQRYYGAAATTPGLVFGRLLKTAQHHIGKMEGTTDKGRYVNIFNDYLEQVLARIGETSSDGVAEFPATLDICQQSLFALGYYHQFAQMNADRAEAIANRNSGDSTTDVS